MKLPPLSISNLQEGKKSIGSDNEWALFNHTFAPAVHVSAGSTQAEVPALDPITQCPSDAHFLTSASLEPASGQQAQQDHEPVINHLSDVAAPIAMIWLLSPLLQKLPLDVDKLLDARMLCLLMLPGTVLGLFCGLLLSLCFSRRSGPQVRELEPPRHIGRSTQKLEADQQVPAACCAAASSAERVSKGVASLAASAQKRVSSGLQMAIQRCSGTAGNPAHSAAADCTPALHMAPTSERWARDADGRLNRHRHADHGDLSAMPTASGSQNKAHLQPSQPSSQRQATSSVSIRRSSAANGAGDDVDLLPYDSFFL